MSIVFAFAGLVLALLVLALATLAAQLLARPDADTCPPHHTTEFDTAVRRALVRPGA